MILESETGILSFKMCKLISEMLPQICKIKFSILINGLMLKKVLIRIKQTFPVLYFNILIFQLRRVGKYKV